MSGSPVEELRSPEVVRHHRRSVRARHAGWVAMFALVAAALAGLLGPGPLSHTTVSDGDLRVHHERFLRLGSTTTVELEVPLGDPTSTPTVLVDRDYLDTFQLEQVTPQPAEVVARDDQLEFRFTPPEDSDRLVVSFDLGVERFGVRRGGLSAGGASVQLRHVIYP